MVYVHRRDDKNVGDIFCAPYLYMDIFPGQVYDILDDNMELGKEKILVIGGGGLGRRFFSTALRRLGAPERSYKLVAWGVGSDTVINKSANALDPDGNYDLYSDYFETFDDVGIRSWSKQQRYRWVPCISAMHKLFDKYRNHKATQLIGYYEHKNRRFSNYAAKKNVETNRGRDLEAKLAFIADHEYIVTNTYHGVYWATLLGRKVLCLPFKSGLFSFKHKPSYITTPIPSDDDLHRTVCYPDSLEECRMANISFKDYLLNK